MPLARSIFLAAFLALAGPSVAGPLEDADAAFERKDYATALRIWRPLADQGSARAQNAIGSMYYAGDGVPQDYAEAVKWYRKAADQGDLYALKLLGNMYEDGRGVLQDYEEAAKWYRKAADQGDATGMDALGVMYYLGRGVPQNYVLAHMWFNLAAARGAVSFRDEAAAKMTPAQIVEAQRLAREWKPKPATGKTRPD
jgi:uncharacterized protein